MNNRIAGGPHDPFSYRLSGKSYDAVASAVTDSALTLRCSVHCSMTPNGSARLWSLRCVGDWLRGGTTVPNREGGIADHLAHLRAISVRLGTCQTEINSDKVCQLNRMSKDTKDRIKSFDDRVVFTLGRYSRRGCDTADVAHLVQQHHSSTSASIHRTRLFMNNTNKIINDRREEGTHQ
jgi:hypothetical protein